MASFNGKVIAITGGASGIGQATAQLLATRGATVSLADVQHEALTATADSIKKTDSNAKVLTKVVNVVSTQEVDAWIQETISQFGKIDGAANLAGITGKGAIPRFVEDVEEDDFDNVIAVNLKGVFNCLKVQLKAMKGQGSGTVVNAASVAGLRAYPSSIAYCASKVRIISFLQLGWFSMTKTAASEYADKNIRVNAIAPGPIDTPMMNLISGEPGQSDLSKKILERVPMKRYGTSEEVAKLIAFLLSEESSYVCGSVITIDGSMSA
ncbi:MAG: hypothetical protein Q9213_006041 [Squamulea squamosa]